MFTTYYRINPKPTESLKTRMVAQFDDREVLRNSPVAFDVLFTCILYSIYCYAMK